MSVEAVCAVITVVLALVGGGAGAAAWFFGVGEKLGQIATATIATAKQLETIAEKMDIVENLLDNHSIQLNDLRDDVTDLQNRVPRKMP